MRDSNIINNDRCAKMKSDIVGQIWREGMAYGQHIRLQDGPGTAYLF